MSHRASKKVILTSKPSEVVINTITFINGHIKLKKNTIGFRMKNATQRNLIFTQSKIATGN